MYGLTTTQGTIEATLIQLNAFSRISVVLSSLFSSYNSIHLIQNKHARSTINSIHLIIPTVSINPVHSFCGYKEFYPLMSHVNNNKSVVISD